MDDEQRRQLETLRGMHLQQLRVLEQQEAKFGIYVPAYIVTEIEERRRQVADIERQLNANPEPELVSTNSSSVGDVQPPVIHQYPYNPSPSGTLTSQQQPNRKKMLDKVEIFWVKGVLEQSLYQIARVELGAEYAPEQVEHPWDTIVQRSSGQVDQVAETTLHIIKIFDNLGGELLILGAPGAGKTTLLLELARDLIARARDDQQHPIPVVFNLSTWGAEQFPLSIWLAKELIQRYDVPRKVAEEWVKANMILSLLDGLDEVAAEHRTSCVEAINNYRREQAGLIPLVVCSRVADYEKLSAKLRLAGAVIIQSLTVDQVEAYLVKIGPSLEAFRAALRADPILWELLNNPLMLSIIVLTYKNKSDVKLRGVETLKERWLQLFNDYIEAMFARRSKEGRYAREQTVRWLSWLARQMQHQGQTVFLIERIQPSLLTPKLLRLYRLGIRLVVGLCAGLALGTLATWFHGIGYGLVFGLSIAITFALAWELTGRPIINVAGGLVLGPAEGVVCGVARGLMTENWLSVVAAGIPTAVLVGLAAGLIRTNTIDVAETLSWSRAQAWRRGLSGGLAVGLVSGLSFAFTIRDSLGPAIIRGVLWGIGTALIAGVALGLSRGQLQVHDVPNEGIRRSLRNAIRWSSGISLGVVLTVVPSSYLGFGLAYGWPAGLERAIFDSINYGLSILLITGIVFGGFACIQHALLRLLLFNARYIPWNYASFLDYCAERIFLHKVGGGYIFVHRLLMEHFAALHNDAETS